MVTVKDRLRAVINSKKCFWICFVGSSIIYLILNYLFSVNFPWNHDDAVVCLSELNRYVNNEVTLWEYLSSFKNGHPQIIQRILSLLSLSIYGAVNLKLILLLCCSMTVALSCLITYYEENIYVNYLTHFVLLGFTNSIFLWVSANAVYQFPFQFLLIYMLISRHQTSLLRAILLAGFASLFMLFSFSSGLAILPVLIILVLLRSKEQNDRTHYFSLSVIIVVASSFILFYLNQTDHLNSSIGGGGHMRFDFSGLWEMIVFICAFSGSIFKYTSFDIDGQVVNSAIGGVILFLITIYFLFNSSTDRREWCLAALSIYVSGVLICIGRFDEIGLRLAVDNRYEFHGVFLLICLIKVVKEEFSTYKSLVFLGIFVLVGINTLKIGWNTMNLPRYKQLHENRAIEFMRELEFSVPIEGKKRNAKSKKIKPIVLESLNLETFELDASLKNKIESYTPN